VTRLADVATVVVTGARGAGKTTWLAHELARRPAGERRAVLLTEAGEASLPAMPDVTVVAAEPGCICCVGQVSLRVALTRLLREARPQRLYLELGEPAHLAASLRTLRSPWLAPVITIAGVVGVFDARAAAPGDDWIDQLTALVLRDDADGACAARIAARRPDLALLA
jgi:G3E family GTPase